MNEMHKKQLELFVKGFIIETQENDQSAGNFELLHECRHKYETSYQFQSSILSTSFNSINQVITLETNNTLFLLKSFYELDTELTYTCVPGYKRIDGFQGAQCFFFNGTARWFGPDLNCNPIDCGRPEEILNGETKGECTTYRCQVGQKLKSRSIFLKVHEVHTKRT